MMKTPVKAAVRCAALIIAAAACISPLSGCARNAETPEKSETAVSETKNLTEDTEKVYNTLKITAQEALERDYIKVTGRYDLLDDGAISCDWTGSGIEFTADCVGKVDVNVSCDPTRIGTGGATNFFTVWVDGQRRDEFLRFSRDGVEIVNGVRVQGRNKNITLATDLPAGEHVFKIAKQSDPRDGIVQINYIRLTGTLLDRPADSGLYIEFIGDSLTAGYGNLGSSVGSPTYGDSSAMYQDGTLAYAYLAAQKLNADVSIVARPGIGLIAGSDHDASVQMFNIYHLSCFWRSDTTEYEPRRTPDLIVYNLGTNDKNQGGDPAEYGRSLKEFIGKLYGYYGEVPVLIIVNRQINDTFYQPTVEAVKDFPLITVTDYIRHTSGYGNHPNVDEGEIEAKKLVNQIKQYYPEVAAKAKAKA